MAARSRDPACRREYSERSGVCPVVDLTAIDQLLLFLDNSRRLRQELYDIRGINGGTAHTPMSARGMPGLNASHR